MFDFHLHTSISFDSEEKAENMVKKAEEIGLKEICFTDHYDFHDIDDTLHNLFSLEDYKNAYDHLTSEKVKLRRGVEMGLTYKFKKETEEFLAKRDFDFVIGSVHYAGGHDPYFPEFWSDITLEEATKKYLEVTLDCVKIHDNFDVLGHLTYVFKSAHNPLHKALPYIDIKDLSDEIMKVLVAKGKGMEINTSGVDRAGSFLPSCDYLKRFKDLGGEIVTIGSDAHDITRIGQYSKEALEIVKDIFGYVCTFENRKPIFHKL